MVIFLFLRNLYATIIPSIAVPVSLVGTFGAMYALGYSLDNLSLMALTISTGFVVDDAIVMIENITRYLEAGDTPMQAAMKGAEQIGFTIISLTVSLIAVLIPLLFMGDVVGPPVSRIRGYPGRHHYPVGRGFADADAHDVLAHSAPHSRRTAGPVLQGLGARLREHDRVLWPHAQVRSGVPDHHAAGSRGHAGPYHRSLHRHPQRDFSHAGYGRDSGHLAGAGDHFLCGHGAEAAATGSIVLQDPAVESLSSFIGADGTNTTLNSGRMSINLKPLNVRNLSASDVIRRLQNSLKQVDGIELFHGAGAEHYRGRPRQPHPIPVHAGGSRPERVESVDRQSLSTR
jgi:multidrug efflux pump